MRAQFAPGAHRDLARLLGWIGGGAEMVADDEGGRSGVNRLATAMFRRIWSSIARKESVSTKA